MKLTYQEYMGPPLLEGSSYRQIEGSVRGLESVFILVFLIKEVFQAESKLIVPRKRHRRLCRCVYHDIVIECNSTSKISVGFRGEIRLLTAIKHSQSTVPIDVRVIVKRQTGSLIGDLKWFGASAYFG